MPATELKYKFGLINSAGKYLTAEKFGGKVNASGASLKAKQVWTLEQDEGTSISYLRAPSGNYLSADKNGNVFCDVECKTDSEDVRFNIDRLDDGKWALMNERYKRYLGCNGENLTCTASNTDDPSVKWIVQLAIHPQVCMKNFQHQRYAHLKINEDGSDKVVVEELVPWGADSTLTLAYLGQGKYALEAFNGKFVQSNGELSASATPEAEFTLLFQSGHLVLRDNAGHYLGVASGSKALKSSSKIGISKENYFILEDSAPQGAFQYGSKFASLKQGEDVSFKLLSDDEITDTETFQLEFISTDLYAVRVCDTKKTSADVRYWKRVGAGIQANGTSKEDANCQFAVEYEGKHMYLRAPGGKYIGVRDNGHLYQEDNRKDFVFRLLNRPKLVLKCLHGFVGVKDSKAELACNRSNFDVFSVSYKEGGYTIQDSEGRYWSIDDADRVVLGASQGLFFFEFHELSKFAIRAESNGKLIKGEQSGLFTANGADVTRDTLWEF
ncbi:fascin-like [Diadema setosum]|uniref:fascin-like n=1 Tax=Diadema setosum TaxID=31175 RepID=UPI003B3AB22C